MCRAVAVVLLAVAVVGLGASPAFAQSKSGKPKAAATALPEPLTHDSIRELVSRLSDEDVRKLLIDQLDRSAAPSKAKDMAMSGMVEHNAGMVRERLRELRDAFVALPATLSDVVAKLDDPDGPSVLLRVVALTLGGLVAAWLAERFYDFALRRYRASLAPPPAETFTARAFRLGVGLALDLVGVAVFALAFLAIFLALWQGHGLRRIAIVELLIGVVAIRVTWIFARFLLAGRAGEERLLPFADLPARQLRRFAILLAVIWGFSSGLGSVLRRAEVTAPTIDVLIILFTCAGVAVVLWTVWQVRAPIARLIRGEGKHNAIVGWLAELWPVIATVFFMGIAAARFYDILDGTPVQSAAGILSVLLVVSLPIVDMMLCRAVACRRVALERGFRRTGVRRGLRGRFSPCHSHRGDGHRPLPARGALGRQPVRRGAGEHGRKDLELALRHLHRAPALLPPVGAREDGDRSEVGCRRRARAGRARLPHEDAAAPAAHADPDYDRRDGHDVLPRGTRRGHPAAARRRERRRGRDRLRLADARA
jgi:hypothetical protein